MSGIFRHAFIPPPRIPVVLSYAADIVAPILSSPVGTETGLTTADGTVSTDDSTGTLYWVVTSSATSPSVAQIQAGQDHLGVAADASGNQAISGLGVQTVNATGITTGVARYFHFQQQDLATNDSTVVSSASFILQAPTLSSPTSQTVAATTGSGTVSTDESNGTLYWVVTQSATSPSIAQVQAVQSNTGAPADDGYNQSVIASGVQNVSVSRLTPETTYYIHYQHQDAAGNDSTVSTSAAFTTSALAVGAGSSALMQNVMQNITQNVMRSNLGVIGGISYSGSSWSVKTSGTSEILRSLWFQGTRWVVCGDNGTILTSDDAGETWISRVSGTALSLRTVKYWGGYWWIVGYGTASTHTILRSPDGTTWTPITVGGGGGGYLVTIGWTSGYLVFGGWESPFDATSGLLVSTTDGSTFNWNPRSELAGVYGLEGNGSTLYVVGSDAVADDVPYLGTTTDGGATVTTDQTSSISTIMTEAIYSISKSADRFAFASRAGEVGYTSLALAGQAAASALVMTPWRITYGNNQFMIAGGNFPDGRILRSVDNGEVYDSVYSNVGIDLVSKVIWGPGYWLAVGDNGTIVKS